MIPKVYGVRLNRSVADSKKRPNFSCVIDNIPLLNSEIKLLGFTSLQKKKDFAKVNLRAKKSINQVCNFYKYRYVYDELFVLTYINIYLLNIFL